MKDKMFILLFDSIHQVMKAEQRLLKQGIVIDLIPVPREISANCGMGIAVQEEQLPKVVELLPPDGQKQPRIYQRLSRGNYQLLDKKPTG